MAPPYQNSDWYGGRHTCHTASGATAYTWNFGQTDPVRGKTTIFQLIFDRSRRATAVTPNERSPVNTNRKSTTRFPLSLRWTLYVALNPPKGAQKAKRPFSVWNCTSLEESLLQQQSFFVWKLSATELWGIHWPNYPCENDWWETSPSTRKFGRKLTQPFHIADFQSVFARSASAVTLSEKAHLSLIGSPLRGFVVSLRWTACLAPKPQSGTENAKQTFCLKNFSRLLKLKDFCVKTVSDRVVRHLLEKWLVGNVPLRSIFFLKRTTHQHRRACQRRG